MKKMTLKILLIFLTSFVSSAQAEELFEILPNTKLQLNRKIFSKIQGFGTTFKVVESTSFESQVNKLFDKTPTAKPMAVQGDFNGDGEMDLAVLAQRKVKGGKIQVAAFLALATKLKRSNLVDYELHVISSWQQAPGKFEQYLSLNEQTYMDFTKANIPPRDLIQLETLGGPTTAYYYLKRSSDKPPVGKLVASPHIYKYQGQFEK